jgi:hypothetical protein
MSPTICNTQIGYCTNVHPGRDLPSILENIERFCLPIRQRVAPGASLGVGLWFSETSAKQTLESANLEELRALLDTNAIVPFTLNGFPQGDFHSQVVKHRVYLPTWWQPERLAYTLQLIQILDGLLPAGTIGSISTLPIAWREPIPTENQLLQAASQLLQVAKALHQLFEKTGRKIVLAIEPEPGCFLTDSASFRSFFNRYLSEPHLSAKESAITHEFLTLCHDVCHAAVMFEEQSVELRQLAVDGIAIGKVQVSSAIEVDWDSKSVEEKVQALDQLSQFAEDRYLHQTNIKIGEGHPNALYQDLGEALSPQRDPRTLSGKWRIHFHVPIFLERFGLLASTQPEILKLVSELANRATGMPTFSGHFEIETYAWGVLPSSMQGLDLTEGIAREIQWFEQILKNGPSVLKPITEF